MFQTQSENKDDTLQQEETKGTKVCIYFDLHKHYNISRPRLRDRCFDIKCLCFGSERRRIRNRTSLTSLRIA